MKSFSFLSLRPRVSLVFLFLASGLSPLALSQQIAPVQHNTGTNALYRPTAAQFRSANGLAIGTDVQAYDADLASWASVTRATGFDTFAATPSSANLAAAVTDETGSGALVFGTSPSLTTPVLGVASGTSLALTGTAGGGFVTFPAQSSAPAAPASGFREFADSTGRKSWIRSADGFTRTWDATLTANRVYTLPDASVTVAGSASALSSGRVTYATTGGLLTDSANLTFSGTVLTLAGNVASTSTSNGTLVISGSGGIGVAGAGYFGGDITTIGSGNNNIFLSSSGANVNRAIRFQRSGADRWFVGTTANETGTGNTGSNFTFIAYDDAGSALVSALQLSRANGNATFNSTTEATTGGVASATFAGGIYAAKKIISNTGLQVGGSNSTAVDLLASATATLDFASISAGASADLTITVTGASTGDSVHLGLPSSPAAGIVFNGFVSAANTVTVRATNVTGSPVDPASATYRATVMSF